MVIIFNGPGHRRGVLGNMSSQFGRFVVNDIE